MDHGFYMLQAYKEALKAKKKNEVPVGAVIVKDQKIIGKAHNTTETDKRCLSHAEIGAIHQASLEIGDWRLHHCSIYVTLEPCLMCAGAIHLSRIQNIIYATKDTKMGAIHSGLLWNHTNRKNPIQVTAGVMEKPCSTLIKDFFKTLR